MAKRDWRLKEWPAVRHRLPPRSIATRYRCKPTQRAPDRTDWAIHFSFLSALRLTLAGGRAPEPIGRPSLPRQTLTAGVRSHLRSGQQDEFEDCLRRSGRGDRWASADEGLETIRRLDSVAQGEELSSLAIDDGQ